VTDWLAANGATLAGTPEENAAAGVTALTPGIRNWTLFAGTLGPVGFSFNAAFFIGAILMLVVFAIQHRGLLETANVQKVIGLLVIIPMAIVGIVPLLTGAVDPANFSPFVPLAAPYVAEPGSWNIPGWTLVLGGMFIAAWSTYGFETAVCYTREFRDPGTDTFKAIFYSGLLCLALFILVPLSFQGVLGLEGMLATPIVDGSGVAQAMAEMVGGGKFIASILVMLMILALILSIMTAMAGSSRTLYQGSVDGWLPRYLSRTNHHGAPTAAMWTDLTANLIVLAIACADATSFFFILAVSNCGYIIFNFLNLNAGWIHRLDSPHVPRPWRAPQLLLAHRRALRLRQRRVHGGRREGLEPVGAVGRPVHRFPDHPGVHVPPLFQDGGKFPPQMLEGPAGEGGSLEAAPRRAGMLPYLTLAAALCLLASNWIFRLEGIDRLAAAEGRRCQTRSMSEQSNQGVRR
jgi:amino acid transporter